MSHIRRLLLALEARILPDALYIKRRYKEKKGDKLNLKSPESFSEKIQWLKLNYRNKLLTQLVDKNASKRYVQEKAGAKYVIPTLRTYDDASQIKLSDLPKSIALKATHGSGWNIIATDTEKMDETEINKYFAFWLSKDYSLYSKEWAYKHVKPQVICEELIFNKDGSLPEDYKIYCFNGVPEIIHVDHGRFGHHTRSFYTNNWIKLDFSIGYPMNNEEIEAPKNLDKMLEVAAKLSNGLPFLRVDLYNIDGNIYCGELTCYPGNGMEIFSSRNWDYKLGKLIDITNI